MPFKISLPWKIGFISIAWLVFISAAHYHLNFEHSDRKVISMGYMPVITNLATPLLDSASKNNTDIRFKALKFSSFAEMAESLRNGKIDAAFIIAPLSIVLKQQGEDIRIVYIGNRHESTLVTRKELNIKELKDLAGKKIAVPMRFSGHNIYLKKLLKQQGLDSQVNVVEMNPPDMASALSSGVLDAYFVGEPFAAQTLYSGDSTKLYYAEEIKENFICNLMVVRNELIQKEPKTVQKLVRAAVRSGIWAQKNTDEAAKIASEYWNQPLDLVKYALSKPKDRTVFNRYLPKQEEMQEMADEMLEQDMIKTNQIQDLVDDSFASKVDLNNITADIQSIF